MKKRKLLTYLRFLLTASILFLQRWRQKTQDRLVFLLAKWEKKTDPPDPFMADTTSQNSGGANMLSRIVLWTIGLFFIIAIIWANYAILDEVSEGEGKVVPASQVQIVQNLEGGIIKKIYVQEGEVVKAGQKLMQLDETRFHANYAEQKLKQLSLQATIMRLDAVFKNVPFVIPGELKAKVPDLVQHEQHLYTSQTSEWQQLQKSYSLAKKEYELTKPLVKVGAASDVEVLHLDRQVSDLQGQISNFQSKTLQELNATKADLLRTDASLAEYQDQLSRTSIVSPVKGIIKQIKINTLGGVSQPGMPLMEIVPLEDTLLIEAQIKPKDIGFLHIGQMASAKISAFDSSVYGALEGKIEKISADSITNPKNESFYLVLVRTNKNYLGTPQKPLYIIPGMVASVSVLTGRKSVMDYILKPIFKARDKALRER